MVKTRKKARRSFISVQMVHTDTHTHLRNQNPGKEAGLSKITRSYEPRNQVFGNFNVLPKLGGYSGLGCEMLRMLSITRRPWQIFRSWAPSSLGSKSKWQSKQLLNQLTLDSQAWQKTLFSITVFSPPARWGLLDFMSDARLLVLVLLLPSSFPPDLICQLWPDFICQPLIAVIVAGHHLPALDRNARRRTSSASFWWQYPNC